MKAPKGSDKAATGDEPRHWLADWAVNILILMFGMTTVVQAFVVPTGSMESNILIGDHLFVDKLAYAPAGPFSRMILPYQEPKRGDIIVFRYPLDIRENYVKRVIGVPGDRIHLENKIVVLNGRRLDEPYVQHITPGIEIYRDNFPSGAGPYLPQRARRMLLENVVNGELLVPPGMYFAMGDNRDDSADSRYWGLVPRENITGKPVFIFWSYDAPTEDLTDPGIGIGHMLDLAQHFFTKTRWSRTFRLLRPYPIAQAEIAH